MTRECRRCLRRFPVDDVYAIARHGGGNYRRAGRWYATWICSECVMHLAPDAAVARGRAALSRIDRYSARRICEIADKIADQRRGGGPDAAA